MVLESKGFEFKTAHAVLRKKILHLHLLWKEARQYILYLTLASYVKEAAPTRYDSLTTCKVEQA
jgi:hypothetical protein